MIIPVGERYQQMLYLLKKSDGKLARRGPAADAVRAHDRRGRSGPRSPARPGQARDPQRRFRGGRRRPAAVRPAGTTSGSWRSSDGNDAPSGKHYVTFQQHDAGPRAARRCRLRRRRPQGEGP